MNDPKIMSQELVARLGLSYEPVGVTLFSEMIPYPGILPSPRKI